MENYDPTIEGQWLVVRVVCFVLTSLIEQYRRTITVDGQLDMVCTYLLDAPLMNERELRNHHLYPTNHIARFLKSFKRAARSFRYSRSRAIHISQRGLHKGCSIV